jgi:hypothetical protein
MMIFFSMRNATARLLVSTARVQLRLGGRCGAFHGMSTLRDSLGDLVADAPALARELVRGFAEMYSGLPVVLGRALPQPLG